MGEEFYDDCQQIPERGKERRKEQREQRTQKRKKYLKYAICSAFGLAVGMICYHFPVAIILLFLFCAYILCTD